jgi:hypothetical protein
MDERGIASFQMRQRLREYDNRLVARVEQTLSPKMIAGLKLADARLSQFSELLNVALQAPSAPVVAEWVRYQMARGATQEQWRGSKLGQAVLGDIADLKRDARQLAAQVYLPEQVERGARELQIKLIRRYAGWLRRRFVAEMGGGADDEQG